MNLKQTIFFSILFITYCCAENKDTGNLLLNKVQNSKWILVVGDECISYFIFKKDGLYKEFDCESNDKFTGEYKIKGDTILTIAKFVGKERCENENPAEKLVIIKNKLFVVYMKMYSSSFKECYNPEIYFNLDTTYNKNKK